MSDRKSRDRRRVGDATRQRIDGLAKGWKVSGRDEGSDAAAPTAEGSAAPVATRDPSPSSPPPPPAKATGSQRAVGAAPPPGKDAGAHGSPGASPPPPPGTRRAAGPSTPPPPPRSKDTGSQRALGGSAGKDTGSQRALGDSAGKDTGSQRALGDSAGKDTGSQRALGDSAGKDTGSQRVLDAATPPSPSNNHGTRRTAGASTPPPPPGKDTGSQRALGAAPPPPPGKDTGSQRALGAGSPPPTRRGAPSRPPPTPPRPQVVATKKARDEATVHDPEAAERLASAEKRVAATMPAPPVATPDDVDDDAETEIAPPRSSRLPPAPRIDTGEVDDEAETEIAPPRKMPPPAPQLRSAVGVDDEAETVAAPPRKMPAPAPVSAVGVDDGAETEIASRDLAESAVPRVRGAAGSRTGSVRLRKSLPRDSGVLGDVAYLWRVIRRLPTAHRELRALEDKLLMEREGRLQRLLEVARNALADADLDTTLVGRAREHLVTLEEMRSRHAGAVAAADEEVGSIERERDEGIAERQDQRDSLRSELGAVNASLEPLRKRQVAARKRFAALERSLDKLDAELTVAEGKLAAADGTADAAALEASLASIRAERESVADEEPEIAGELDALEPKIASLESERDDIAERIAKLSEEDERARVRADEKLAAVRASQTVEDRAASDLASERQDALLALGESLSDQRPAKFTHRLRSVEEQDLTIATLHRRIVELREEIEGIERWAVARGALWVSIAIAVVAGVVLLAMSR